MSRKEDVPDVPKLANAAQMASRNIKNAKGSRRPRPIQSNSAPQSMSFGGGDGGLFGGSAQGGSSFDFAAPDAPKIQFPPSPYGGSYMFGPTGPARDNYVEKNTLSSDEEEMRRKKPFQGTISSSSTPPPSSSNAPIQSNIFGGQQSFGFNSLNGQAQQSSNPFTFQTSSQPASPGLGAFNSPPTQDKPASNIFSFNAPPSQPASPSPSITFGSGPTQDKSTSNMFNFSQPQAQPAQASSSIFNIKGSAPDQPPNSPFGFNQTTTQPSSPGFFASAPATQAPSSNLFGTSQNTPAAGINFGSTPATERPTTNMFGNSSSNSLFGGASQQSAPTPAADRSLFNGNTKVPTENQENTQPTANIPTTNMFGSSPSKPLFGSAPQQSAPRPNPFSQLNTPAAPSSNLFGSQPEPQSGATPSTLFGGQVQQPPTTDLPPNSAFGKIDNAAQSPAPSTSSLFSNPNKPAESPAPSTSSLFSNPNKPAESPTPFTSSLFSNLNKTAESPALSASSIFSNLNQSTQPTSNLFGNQNSPAKTNMFEAKATSSTSDLFGNLNKPIEQPAAQVNGTPVNATGQDTKTSEVSTSSLFNKKPSTNSFGGSSMFSAPTSQTEATNAKSTHTFSLGSSQPSAPTTQTNGTSQSSLMKPIDAPASASQPPPSGMFPKLPSPSPAKSNDTTSKSVASTAVTTTNDERSSSSNALVHGNGTTDVDRDSLYAEMAAASSITDEQLLPLLPSSFSESQKNEFYAAYRLRSLNKAIEKFFASVPFGTGLGNLIAYYNEKKIEILDRISLPIPGSKRRFTDDEEQENQNSSKRSRQVAPPKSNIFQPHPAYKPKTLDERDENQENENPSKRTRSDEASNSNIFQAAQPQKPTAQSPEKSRSENQPSSYLNGSTPKAPLFTPPSFAPPMTSSNPASVATPSTKGKRKAEVQLTKDDHEREEQENRRMKTPKINGDTNGSNTSNIFKGIVNSPGKKVAPLPGASPTKKTAPNPFGGLPVPKSTNSYPSRSDVLERVGTQPDPNHSEAPESLGTPKEASTSSTNMFAPKPASTESKPDASKPAQTGPPKFGPPQFGPGVGKVDFFAQFQAKAKARDETNEHNLMAKAMEDDLDSDEDEETREQWKAEWTAKRKAKLEELENISKRGTGFVPSASSSVFSSRTSTPGPFGSSTGSVLDGQTPGKPPIFGAENIFGHLSGASSGVDNGQTDEDTTSESDGEEDSENKDPNYIPDNDESGSGPGTPVEETGAGIASAKKATSSVLFGSSPLGGGSGAGSPSGTNSPSRSLFDRITRVPAAAGDTPSGTSTPGRSLLDRITYSPVLTENKENTQPTTNANNPFASLNKSLAAPADQTWKPDTPIKFGSASSTPTDSANPTVSVTEATPTKPPTTNLFANLGSSSTLFGSSAPKISSMTATPASPGFNFGSPAASLLPSAAASTTTSRATSPGNTTDGVSGDEEPDAEKHEQLDLTAGGPGEEDEEVIHSVRAKANQFSAEGGSWTPKGVGILRALKHKETGATRLVLRGDPSGKVILNKSLLAQVTYTADKKTVKFLAAADEGSGLETWLLQVKTTEMAEALAGVLEANK